MHRICLLMIVRSGYLSALWRQSSWRGIVEKRGRIYIGNCKGLMGRGRAALSVVAPSSSSTSMAMIVASGIIIETCHHF